MGEGGRDGRQTGGAILDLEGESCFLPSRLHVHVANRRTRSDELPVRHGGEQTAPCSFPGRRDVVILKEKTTNGKTKAHAAVR